MPLIILGIIVVVGAGLMIYYQVGPTIRTRIKTPYGGQPSSPNPDSKNAFGGFIDLEAEQDLDDESVDDEDEYEDEDERKTYGKSSDGKVLYIFDAGKTELRPLNEEEDKEGKEEEESDE